MLQLIEAEWHIYASVNKTTIDLNSALSPAQAITWTN